MKLEASMSGARRSAPLSAVALATVSFVMLIGSPARAVGAEHRTFATPEEAARALIDTVKAGKLDDLLAFFGPEGQELIESSDPATGRANRQVFVAAVAEGWRLENRDAKTKELVIGNEEWPFPVPIVNDAGKWKFDTAAGKEEVLARRIGRNELAVIQICQTYVLAQRAYAARGHDGKPAGLYARRFHSEAGTQNGLYWPVARGERRSPLGDMVAQAAAEGRQTGTASSGPVPFHGYYFRILEAQGPAAPGGAKSYVAGGELSGGFALIAWPAQYDASGVMTFIVNQDGVVYEKDLGADTTAAAKAITRYDPDKTWRPAQGDAPSKP